MPEAAATTMIAAVRTIPTRATAWERCSGKVHGSVLLPSAAGASAAFRAKVFCTPADATASCSVPRSAGSWQAQSWLWPACRARTPVATGRSGSPGGHPAAILLATWWSSSIGSAAPAAR